MGWLGGEIIPGLEILSGQLIARLEGSKHSEESPKTGNSPLETCFGQGDGIAQ